MKAIPIFLNILLISSLIQIISPNPSYEDYTFLFLEKFKIGSRSKEINMIINSITSKSVLFTNSKRDYSEEIQKNRKSDVLIDKINFNGQIIPSFPFNLKLDETQLNDVLVDTLYENKIITDKILQLEITQENKNDILKLNFEPIKEEFTFCNLSSKLEKDNYYSEAWICDLSHIIIGSNKGDLSWNNTLETNGKVVFDTRTKYIYIPKNYLKYFNAFDLFNHRWIWL